MGIRRKKITNRRRGKIEGLLERYTPELVHEQLFGTRDQVGLSTIYKIRSQKTVPMKVKPDLKSDKMVEQQPKEVTLNPRLMKHTADVLNILNIYVSQLRIGYEPEDFLSLPEKEIPNGRWLDYWAYVKDIVPSIDRLIDEQINSERICITQPLEIEPSFVALEGHYEGTKLWENIKNYKRARDAYVGAGIRLHKIVTIEISRFSLQVPEETKVVLEALKYLVQIKATQTRVKLNLELIETDWGTVLKNLPGASSKALQRFLEFVNKYKNKPHSESKNDVQETQHVGKLILELMDRLENNYEPVKRLYKAITRAAEGEKLKGTLPPGTKCKFCSSV